MASQLEAADSKENNSPAKKRKRDTDTESSLEEDAEKWRVKLYKLNTDGSWDDCGTGRILVEYAPKDVYQEPMLHMQSETGGHVLLRTRILMRDAYQRQGDNIITWCEPYFSSRSAVDLALSFQDTAGCLDIWHRIMSIQQNVQDMAHAVAAAHHVELQRQQQQQQQQHMWEHVASEVHSLQEKTEQVAVSMAAAAAAAYAPHVQPLPNPPSLDNLEEIADIIAAGQQLQQRESLACCMARNDCAYLKALLHLFPSAEARGDYGALATLAACIKTILLMNDPSTMELILESAEIYEQICAVLEYDPDLRQKANHRWFLRNKVKFRTVVEMNDPELISTIHKSFRVAYLRDTLLRPTMDESCLSTLSSLQTFTHAHVVKGVTQGGNESYLCKIMVMLGKELPMIAKLEWSALEGPQQTESLAQAKETADSKNETTCWKQHVAPQDGSLASRLLRRQGALSFFRELFNMVRISLSPGDKDDFYAAIVNMEVELDDGKDIMEAVNLLSLLGNVLSDPTALVSEKGGVLEIISGIAMHDPSHIRRHCLDVHQVWKKEGPERITCPERPNPNDAKQVIFFCGPNDLLAMLLFLMAVETDAGLLLQTSEIMRIILDTEMLGEHGPMEAGGPPGMHHPTMDLSLAPGSMNAEQNQFLAMFYEHYVQWLVAPFQYTVLHPVKRMPDTGLASPNESLLMKRILDTFRAGVSPKDPLLRIVPMCAIRSSFAVELLSFCVRAHLHRMKFFLLRSRVLGSVLSLLKPNKSASVTSGDRCLKLAALRFLRSILSVKDEFYHRHIIQHDLFAPVFEAFRSNPVGDNLVSSAIVEMCDFIHNQNIKSLIEYIVTKHLSAPSPSSVTDRPSLEEVATPYVQTLTILRRTYEDDLRFAKSQVADEGGTAQSNGAYFDNSTVPRAGMSEKALEDQRKFREEHDEESYFDSDDDEEGLNRNDETRDPLPTEGEGDLHRTPRMFSFSEQASSLDPPETGDDRYGNNPDRETSASSLDPPGIADDNSDENMPDAETAGSSIEPPGVGQGSDGRMPDAETTTSSLQPPVVGEDMDSDGNKPDGKTTSLQPPEVGEDSGGNIPDAETTASSLQ